VKELRSSLEDTTTLKETELSAAREKVRRQVEAELEETRRSIRDDLESKNRQSIRDLQSELDRELDNNRDKLRNEFKSKQDTVRKEVCNVRGVCDTIMIYYDYDYDYTCICWESTGSLVSLDSSADNPTPWLTFVTEIMSDYLPVANIDFSRIQTHNLLYSSRKSELLNHSCSFFQFFLGCRHHCHAEAVELDTC